MAEHYTGGRGVVASIEIGRSYGSTPGERKMCCVKVRHGPDPKPSKGNAPTPMPPQSDIYVTEAQAKRLKLGARVLVKIVPAGEEIPQFKTARERDRWLSRRPRGEPDGDEG